GRQGADQMPILRGRDFPLRAINTNPGNPSRDPANHRAVGHHIAKPDRLGEYPVSPTMTGTGRRRMRLQHRITNLLHSFPGYTGYRDKEDRRDDDKRIRVAVADRIQQSIDRLTSWNAELAAARELKVL